MRTPASMSGWSLGDTFLRRTSSSNAWTVDSGTIQLQLEGANYAAHSDSNEHASRVAHSDFTHPHLRLRRHLRRHLLQR